MSKHDDSDYGIFKQVDPEYYPVKIAARKLRKHLTTIYEYVNTGILESKTIDGQIFVLTESLRKYQREHNMPYR